MTDPFATYGLDLALGTVGGGRQKAKPLTGPIPTRAEARRVYQQIVAELEGCDDATTLDLYLMTIGEELIQFQGELDHLWNAHGEFAGLATEIQNAIARTGSDFRLERAGNPGRA